MTCLRRFGHRFRLGRVVEEALTERHRRGLRRIVVPGAPAHVAVACRARRRDVCWGAFNYGYGSPLKVYDVAAMGKPSSSRAQECLRE